MICIDLGEFRQFLRIVRVVRYRVMRFSHTHLWIGSCARFASELESYNASEVGLKRQHLQIEHQPRMVLPSCGRAERTIDLGKRRIGSLLRGLQAAALELPHRTERWIP